MCDVPSEFVRSRPPGERLENPLEMKKIECLASLFFGEEILFAKQIPKAIASRLLHHLQPLNDGRVEIVPSPKCGTERIGWIGGDDRLNPAIGPMEHLSTSSSFDKEPSCHSIVDRRQK